MALTRINNQALTNVTSAGLPSGTVLQVLDASYGTQVNLTVGSWVDTGLSLSITPSSTSSKIFALYVVNFKIASTNIDTGVGLRLVRDSTVIDQSTTTYDNYTYDSGQPTEWRGSDTEMYLDNPSTTSLITYKVQANAYKGSCEVQNAGNKSKITLMEIAG